MQANAALSRAAISTFEKLTFLLASDAGEPDPSVPNVVACVDITGAAAGRLVVRAPDGIVRQLAAEMLAVAETPSRELVHDAFGELCNVICGNVLPALLPAGAVCRLARPVVTSNGATPASPTSTRIGIDGEVVELWLELEPESGVTK